jgi:3-hydroxyacyl-CoA dehydrogenase
MGAMGIGVGAEMDLPEPPEGGAAIQSTVLVALANEGARCLEEGLASLPRDVDAAALFHGILPPWMGGPMYQADLVGAMAMRLRLQQMTDRAPGLFAPSPLWDRLVADGQSLGDLSRERVSRARGR